MATINGAKRTTRKKVDVPPEANQDRIDLQKTLASFGFDVPQPVVNQWEITTVQTLQRVAIAWEKDRDAAREGWDLNEDDRQPVPPILSSFEAVSAELGTEITAAAREKPDAPNPYPVGTLAAKIWQDASEAPVADEPTETQETAPVAEADGEANEGSIEVSSSTPDATPQRHLSDTSATPDPTPGTTPPAAEPAQPTPPSVQGVAAVSTYDEAVRLNQQRAEERQMQRFRQQMAAIQAAQNDLNEAADHQADLEEQLVDLKSDLKELKSSFDAAGQRVRKAARALRKAKAGSFDSTLPFPVETADVAYVRPAPLSETLSPGNVDVNASGEVVPAAESPKPVRDEGAFVPLQNLVKGTLQEYIPGNPEDKGISEKQLEKLLAVLEGETIGDLEKFQKAKGQWWVKEIPGFGSETITKLQDAQEIIRRKFPIPSADDPAPEPAPEQPAVPVEQKPETATPESEVHELTADEAIKRLNVLADRCADLQNEIDNEDGISFLASVMNDAESMVETIEERDVCTAEQARAIANWEPAVEKWAPKDDGDDFGDMDEDDDE